jgi:FtsP/CotA-like multicopper oxidase with cupredoxin domain
MENIGWDAPFGGDFGPDPGAGDVFPDRQTDRIMAFDVVLPRSDVPDNFDASRIGPWSGNTAPVDKEREVALFEGKDEFGRLQPLLGTKVGSEWKAIAWHSPTTEKPTLGETETWDIYNFTGDAHPVHLHLVNFEVEERRGITFDSDDGDPGQPVIQHNGTFGVAPVVTNVEKGRVANLGPADGYAEDAPKDMVTALPEQVTRVKATFDKPGRYVWHCHILSHEDHEMMRVLEVVDDG